MVATSRSRATVKVVPQERDISSGPHPMRPFPEQPSDEVIAELVSEIGFSLSIFERSLGDGGAAEELASTVPSMSLDLRGARQRLPTINF